MNIYASYIVQGPVSWVVILHTECTTDAEVLCVLNYFMLCNGAATLKYNSLVFISDFKAGVLCKC